MAGRPASALLCESKVLRSGASTGIGQSHPEKGGASSRFGQSRCLELENLRLLHVARLGSSHVRGCRLPAERPRVLRNRLVTAVEVRRPRRGNFAQSAPMCGAALQAGAAGVAGCPTLCEVKVLRSGASTEIGQSHPARGGASSRFGQSRCFEFGNLELLHVARLRSSFVRGSGGPAERHRVLRKKLEEAVGVRRHRRGSLAQSAPMYGAAVSSGP